jgi:hypothetical protein
MHMTNGKDFEDRGDPNTAHRITFLHKIIDDTQSTIRFTDSKAAFGIAVLSAMLGKILGRYPTSRPFMSESWLVIILIGLFSLSGMVAAVLAFRVLFPTINPYKNVRVRHDLPGALQQDGENLKGLASELQFHPALA